jgi:hypothetical protein
MTDLKPAPWHTESTGAWEHEYKREADRADREKDRADGAEAHTRDLLTERVWVRAVELGYDPDLIPADRMESIVDSLWGDMEGGTRAADLTPDIHLHTLLGAK